MKRVLVMFVAACVAVVFSHVLRVNAEEGKGEHGDAFKAGMLKKFDKDGDGKLNDAEKEEMKKAHEARKAEWEKKMLEKWDKDKDGKLSDEEKAEMKKAHEAEKAEMIKKFDKDGDGKLNDAEKAEMIKAMREKHGEKKPEAPAQVK